MWPFYPQAARNALIFAVLPSALLGAYYVLKYLWGKKIEDIGLPQPGNSNPKMNFRLSYWRVFGK
jgi:hypothetical protein